jgi:hypothetical protein
MTIRVATILLLAASLAACREDPARTGSRLAAEAPGAGLKTSDLDDYGENLTEAVRIHEIVRIGRMSESSRSDNPRSDNTPGMSA